MATPRERPITRARAAGSRPAGDRILLVEADPSVSDLIGRQTLQAGGYQVQVATDASSAIARALQWTPDLIMIDLRLPDLSGKDLMVALASQGIQTPLIVIAQQGSEADIIQAFRLGAADFLLLPVREAEVINAVNRVLKQVHDRRERERLAQRLQQANQELQMRVRELTTIFALSRAMTSITDQADLLDKILDAAIRITQANRGWFLLREDAKRPFMVVAQHNLPEGMGVHLHQPWDDGISSLVAMSGEMLSIHGEALLRFKISSLGQAALIVPIKVQKIVLGLLVIMRGQAEPFGASEQHLLDALSDYTSISLANARLVRALEDKARNHQQTVRVTQLVSRLNSVSLRAVKDEVSGPLARALNKLKQFIEDPALHLRPNQRQQLALVQDQLLRVNQVAAGVTPLQEPGGPFEKSRANLNDLLAQSLHRMLPFAQPAGISFSTVLPERPVIVKGDADLLAQAINGLFINLLKLSGAGARFSIHLGINIDNQAHLVVKMDGPVLAPKDADSLFAELEPQPGKRTFRARSGAPGVPLPLIKDILGLYEGRIWVSDRAGEGRDIHIVLPAHTLN